MNRILIIDDDAVTLEALPALLRSRLLDTVVDTARDADAALRLLRENRYQLIFLDVHMPSAGGLRLLRQVRACAIDTPVIVMTAHLNELVETELSQAGVYAFLRKPAFPDLVIAKVISALRPIP